MTQQSQQPPASQVPKSAQPTLGELVARISDNITALVHGEIDLAKAKGKRMATKLGVGAGMLAAAGVVALYGLGFLLGSFVELIALALPLWAAKLIVAVVLFIVAAIAALLGKKRLDAAKADTPAPQEGLKNDINLVRTAVVSGLEKGNQP